MLAATAPISDVRGPSERSTRSCSWRQILAILERHGFGGQAHLLQQTAAQDLHNGATTVAIEKWIDALQPDLHVEAVGKL
jgi:hypothetical protein